MKLTWVLPPYIPWHSGGYRVHHQLATELATRHEVRFCHVVPGRTSMRWRLVRAVRGPAIRQPTSWVTPASPVVPEVLSADAIRWADSVICTGNETILAVPPSAAAVCVVYDYEYWALGSDEDKARLRANLARLDGRLIATSGVVADMLQSTGLRVLGNIGTGIDTTTFRCQRAPEARRPSVVTMLRDAPHHRTGLACSALESLSRSRPTWQLLATGRDADRLAPSCARVVDCPDDASLATLLNDSAVFLYTSSSEGFGLPGLEAMACGAALVTTDAGGTRDYARHGETALVVRDDPASVVAGVEAVGDDLRLRADLAAAGAKLATDFDFRCSAARLEAIVTEVGP